MGNVQILLRQHVGAPCAPCVEVGADVKKGTLIATPTGLGANIFSSVYGKVAEITAQSRNIKHNFKNIGRIMMGKDAIPYPNDVQKLSVLQRAGTSLFHKIEGLHQKTVSTYKKLDNMGKTSVKKDLKQIENNKANDAKFLEKVLPKENSR